MKKNFLSYLFRCLCQFFIGGILSFSAVSQVAQAAQAAQPPDAIAQLQGIVQNLRSSTGEFTQYRVTKDANKDAKNGVKLGQKNSGEFQFLKPGRFIWHYQKPYEQLLQSDGKYFYVFDKDLKQVTRQILTTGLGFGEAIEASPAGILFVGLSSLNQNFTLKNVADKNDGMTWVEATPKKSGQFIRVGIGMKNNTIAVMELYDSFGQASLIQLDKVRSNPSLNTAQFHFVVPKDVELIDNPLN